MAAEDRAKQTRENYARLRAAGVVAKEAKVLRCKSISTVEAAIKEAQARLLEEAKDLAVVPEGEPAAKAVKGNQARRFSPEENKLVDLLRTAGMDPEEVRDMLEDRLSGWVVNWRGMVKDKVPGAKVMVAKLERQLEVVRGQ
jgi:hypothetical protein